VSTDPLKEEYLNLSPYVYCANNPIKYVDDDGRSIKIFPKGNINAKSFIEVAATQKGGEKLKAIINSSSPFKIEKATSWGESSYDSKRLTIRYKESNSLYLNFNDTWSKSGATIFGHEMSHAYDHLTGQLFSNYGGKQFLNFNKTERNAGDFGNYIRSVYNMTFYRDEYRQKGQTILTYNTSESYINPNNEKITGMKLLGGSQLELLGYSGATMMTVPSYSLNKNQMVGVSYEQSFTNGDEETATTMYMLTWMNDKGEIDFFKTSNINTYNDKVSSMQGTYSFSTERKILPGIK
jgi:hypothetical protein